MFTYLPTYSYYIQSYDRPMDGDGDGDGSMVDGLGYHVCPWPCTPRFRKISSYHIVHRYSVLLLLQTTQPFRFSESFILSPFPFSPTKAPSLVPNISAPDLWMVHY